MLNRCVVLVGVIALLAGTMLIFFGSWLTWTEIVPGIAATGWSLEGSNLILNHDWKGNQLYLLVMLYHVSGAGLGAAGIRCIYVAYRRTREEREMRRRFARNSEV